MGVTTEEPQDCTLYLGTLHLSMLRVLGFMLCCLPNWEGKLYGDKCTGEPVACGEHSINARHERKLKNNLGDCGCALCNQLKAGIEEEKPEVPQARGTRAEGSSSSSLGLRLARRPCRHSCESVP